MGFDQLFRPSPSPAHDGGLRPSAAIFALMAAVGLTGPTSMPGAQAGDTVTVSLSPVRTNTLYEDADGVLSGGHSVSIFAGDTNNGLHRRALLAFDLAGQIPAGGTIQNAALVLKCEQTISGLRQMTLHRVLADWGSGASEPFPPGGAGAPAAAGDATWIHRFYDPQAPDGGPQRWATAGGDFAPTPLATTGVENSGLFYTWSSDQLTAEVASWAADPAGNHGLLLRGAEGSIASAKRFDSQFADDVESRPRLDLTILLAAPHCVADLGVQGGGFGHDGVLNNNDFISFITLFFAQSPDADLGQQGGLPGSDSHWDNNDFIAFISAFFDGAGCV